MYMFVHLSVWCIYMCLPMEIKGQPLVSLACQQALGILLSVLLKPWHELYVGQALCAFWDLT